MTYTLSRNDSHFRRLDKLIYQFRMTVVDAVKMLQISDSHVRADVMVQYSESLREKIKTKVAGQHEDILAQVLDYINTAPRSEGTIFASTVEDDGEESLRELRRLVDSGEAYKSYHWKSAMDYLVFTKNKDIDTAAEEISSITKESQDRIAKRYKERLTDIIRSKKVGFRHHAALMKRRSTLLPDTYFTGDLLSQRSSNIQHVEDKSQKNNHTIQESVAESHSDMKIEAPTANTLSSNQETSVSKIAASKKDWVALVDKLIQESSIDPISATQKIATELGMTASYLKNKYLKILDERSASTQTSESSHTEGGTIDALTNNQEVSEQSTATFQIIRPDFKNFDINASLEHVQELMLAHMNTMEAMKAKIDQGTQDLAFLETECIRHLESLERIVDLYQIYGGKNTSRCM